jgi:DNA-binding MarR family transcriptional regulator
MTDFGPRRRRSHRLAHVLHALSRGIRREVLEELRPMGVDVRDWTTLEFLHDRPMSSNAELSRRLGVTPQAVHTVVLSLEERKLIARHADPNHGRVARFDLTDQGREVLGACNTVANRVESRVFADLSSADQRALLDNAITALRRLEHGPDSRADGQWRRAKPRN